MDQKFGNLLKGFFLAIIILVGVFGAKISKADDRLEMSDYYSSTNKSGDFIDNTTLLLTKEGVSSDTVQFRVLIQPKNPPSVMIDPNDNTIPEKFVFTNNSEGTATPTGKIDLVILNDSCPILGSWCALYDPGSIDADPGEGVWVDIAKKSELSSACLNDDINQINPSNFTDDGCFDTPDSQKNAIVFRLLKRDPNRGNRLLITNNLINESMRFSGLTPETEYVARIRLEENDSTDSASSKLLTFTTEATGTPSITQQGIDEVSSSSTVDDETGLPECGIFGTSSVMGCVAQIIYYVAYKPTNWVMVLTGEIMDWGIHYSISSKSYPVTGHSFVTDGWRIMRDIANITFIFILIYIAITTILGQKKERLIGSVILVALIINFSLFFSKVIVDFGNITSRFFYNNMSVTSSKDNSEIYSTSITSPDGKSKSISYGFAATFNPAKLFQGLTTNTTISANGVPTGTGLSPNQFASFFALFSLIGGAVNLIAAFVFFSLAWLFIARTAGLWLAMIASPLAFLSLALPTSLGSGDAEKYTNMKAWWKNITRLAIMPTVALMLIFLILTFLKANIFSGFFNETTTTGQFMSILIPLAVISILLLKTKKIAEEYSGDFGSALGKVGSFVGGAAVGLATGGAALAGRRVLGGLGSKMAETSTETRFGRNVAMIGRRMESGTYDLKNTKLGQYGIKSAGYDSKYTTGATTVKTGYKDYKEAQTKKREEYKESMLLGKDSKEVKAVEEAKEKEDKSKEGLESAAKAKREAQNEYDTMIKRKKENPSSVLELEEKRIISDLEEATKKHKEVKEKHELVSEEHKKAKATVKEKNSKITDSIAGNIDRDGQIEKNYDKLESEKSYVKKAGAIAGIATGTVGKIYKDSKDVISGSISGRDKTVEELRKKAKKEREEAEKTRKSIEEAGKKREKRKEDDEKIEKAREKAKKEKEEAEKSKNEPSPAPSPAPQNTSVTSGTNVNYSNPNTP